MSGSSKKKKAAESRAVASQREFEVAASPQAGELQREQILFGDQAVSPLTIAQRFGIADEVSRYISEGVPADQALFRAADNKGLGGIVREQLSLSGRQPTGLEGDVSTQLRERAFLTPETLLRQTGPITGQLMDLIQGRLGRPGEELLGEGGPISKQALDLARRATEDPEKFFFADTFKPNLELVRQSVAQQSARRGITPESGLTLENLGRTGLDLAIKDALGRQQARVLGLQTGASVSDLARSLEQQARAEAGGVSDVARGEGTGARGELQTFLTNLQRLVDAQRNRGLQGTQARTGTETGFHSAQAEREAQGQGVLAGSLGQLLGSMALAPSTGGASLLGNASKNLFTSIGQTSSDLINNIPLLNLIRTQQSTPSVGQELALSRSGRGGSTHGRFF